MDGCFGWKKINRVFRATQLINWAQTGNFAIKGSSILIQSTSWVYRLVSPCLTSLLQLYNLTPKYRLSPPPESQAYPAHSWEGTEKPKPTLGIRPLALLSAPHASLASFPDLCPSRAPGTLPTKDLDSPSPAAKSYSWTRPSDCGPALLTDRQHVSPYCLLGPWSVSSQSRLCQHLPHPEQNSMILNVHFLSLNFSHCPVVIHTKLSNPLAKPYSHEPSE